MKWGLVLSAVIVTGFLLEFGLCQKKDRDTGEVTEKNTKAKPKAEKSMAKKIKTSPPKPKVRASPEPPPPAAQASLTQVLDKGKFHKVGDTLSVPAGNTLELRCKGKPVQWAVPYYLEEEDEGRLRMVQHDRYGSLILANSTGADTGEYTCYPMYCEDKDCRKEYDRAIKVFVFFPDPQELFVPSDDYYEVVQLRTNRPTTLPCQVTSPLATVTLHREFPPEDMRVDGTEISFDMKRGFTIHRPRPHHAGTFYCMASHGGLRQSSTKYILIYVNYPIAPPSPVIQASASSVRLGENLQVTCSVLGEADVVIDFTWEYPGQKIGRPLYTQDSVRPVRVGGQARQQSETVLLVDGVRDVDEGTYTCTAHNLEGARSVSTTVKVLPAHTTPRPRKP
ncbi:platelet-derived growth factor receptor-like protein [Megalops cyprinoides]|uniref:platelet-derived growth factor receptor-like protein n=1 Tax=Megalops cyprinoides TaxID=118141 RepID=UPI0018651730|nr:platelet-derived growth factor receptor-like protein [Megalops cyprinoides]